MSQRCLRFELNGETIEVADMPPCTTLLQWLRQTGRVGTKEGCAEGDCGACAVVQLESGPNAGWRVVNACLVLLPSVDGKRLLTVEGLAQRDALGRTESLHPVQLAMVNALGSQCGFCTPGFVMSLFEACHRRDIDAKWKLDDQLCGNLCRCTGYRPIREAATAVAGTCPKDGLGNKPPFHERLPELSYEALGDVYERPTSLDDLFRAMARLSEYHLVAGATDLGIEVTKRHRRYPALIALDAISELSTFVALRDGGVRIGAAVTLSQLESQAATHVPVIARMLRYFASRPIKNRATLGGNLCTASPIGDLASVLMALNATLVLQAVSGTRRVPIDAFFLSYRKTALLPGEILAWIEVPPIEPGTRLGAYKVSKRRELDISAVCAGFAVKVEGGVVQSARLCYGGMAETCRHASRAEATLLGKPLDEAHVTQAMAALDADFSPIGDHRGSAWYRQTVAQNLLLGFFHETESEPCPTLPDRSAGTVVPEGSR